MQLISPKTDLNTVTAFTAVAEAGSYTAAADSLGLPKSYLSRKVRELEERLGVRLFTRTTRRIALTDDGRGYFAVCKRALQEIADVEMTFDQAKDIPRGHLRLTCPVEFGALITEPLVKTFLNRNPGITLDIVASNVVMDLVRDQIDVAIRPAQLADPAMISMKLAELTWSLYASPVWLHENSKDLQSIDDLKNVDVIGFNPSTNVARDRKFQVTDGKHHVSVQRQPRLVASTIDILVQAVLSDGGVAALPTTIAEKHVHANRMKLIFPDWYARKDDVFAVYQDRRLLPSRVRALLDFLKTIF